jgi:hypothetical protein
MVSEFLCCTNYDAVFSIVKADSFEEAINSFKSIVTEFGNDIILGLLACYYLKHIGFALLIQEAF